MRLNTRNMNTRHAVIALVIAAGSLLGLSGCAASEQMLPPVIADLSLVDGTTVTVPLERTVDLTGDEESYTAWSAEIADSAIVRFVPGKDEGGASFNPGLTPLVEGSTEVTLTNADTDATVSFTVEVTPAAG